MGAQQREARGRCFNNMVLDATYHRRNLRSVSFKKEDKIHQFTYRFTKIKTMTNSLLNGHMSCGDAITVSVEPELVALARGFIVELTPDALVLGLDHELNIDTVSSRLKARRGSAWSPPVIFRIDKDELFGGMGRIRDNLAHLFYAGGDSRRLELVVDLRKPQFDVANPVNTMHTSHLNASQRVAMQKVLTAQDYALILGMPGTGKTTVIAAIIKELVGMGKTVLLTSYTHSAVDNILMKLKVGADFNILRLGNLDKVRILLWDT